MHPSAGKPFNQLKKRHTLKVNADLKERTYKISANCEKCPEYGIYHFRFRAEIPFDNIVHRKSTKSLTGKLRWTLCG